MTPAPDQEPARRGMMRLLIALAVAMACGRILCAQLLFEPSVYRRADEKKEKGRTWPTARPTPMPTFGSNDRSRWATIHNLVDKGTYVIGERDKTTVIASAATPLGLLDPWQVTAVTFGAFQLRTSKNKTDTGIIFQEGWESVDKVLHPEKLEYYSSKPPLLATILAGLYWLLQTLFGWNLQTHPSAVVRTILVLVNAGTFWLYLHWLARVVERYGRTDWGKLFVFAAGCFATFMTPFLITLNNHTLGTVCVLGTLACVLKIWEAQETDHGQPAGRYFVGAGFLAALAVTHELPAAAFAAAVFLLLVSMSPKWTVRAFLPTALLVAAAFFATNYLAVGQWQPVNSEFGSPWYAYEGGHFRVPNPGETPSGIDFARYKESRATYAFHLLLGHHGWFSLTPIWLLALAGLVSPFSVRLAKSEQLGNTATNSLPRFLPILTLAVSLVVFTFYLVKTDNYGGWTVGPRWLMWLTPLWLICLLPIVDRLGQSSWGRRLAYLCLGVSVLSVHYSLWNPWRHPWIYDLMLACGWAGY